MFCSIREEATESFTSLLKVVWTSAKMRERDGTKEKKRKEKRIFSISITFLFFSLVSSVPYSPFYGADESRIREKPKYLKICHREDSNLDSCIKSSLEKFMESANSGSPELNLPSIDPIQVPVIEFNQGSGNVSIHMLFKNFRIEGFKNFRIINVKSNLADSKFEISMESPFVNMMATFSAEGGVFTFPISAEGNFNMNLTEVSTVFILRLATTDQISGYRYFYVEDSIMDLLPGDINANFGEYIDGSNAIGKAFNSFFNKNALEIFTTIKPKISGILATIFSEIANEILSRHPDDVLLPL